MSNLNGYRKIETIDKMIYGEIKALMRIKVLSIVNNVQSAAKTLNKSNVQRLSKTNYKFYDWSE